MRDTEMGRSGSWASFFCQLGLDWRLCVLNSWVTRNPSCLVLGKRVLEVSQALMKAVDTNNDALVSREELIAYLLKEKGSVLNDKSVSRAS